MDKAAIHTRPWLYKRIVAYDENIFVDVTDILRTWQGKNTKN